MALEIEIKLSVESHDPVREKLLALGATSKGSGVETNELFDRPDGWLRRQGQGLRIRSFVCDKDRETRITLTAKGPRHDSAMKSREEAEIEISDAVTAARVLNMLGFVRVMTYQKHRESWTLDRCFVELDSPPHVGLFVEIEGPDEEAIRAVRRRLQLERAGEVKATYVGMLADYCDQHGLVDRNVPLP